MNPRVLLSSRAEIETKVEGRCDPGDQLPKCPQDLKRSSLVIHKRKTFVTGNGEKN